MALKQQYPRPQQRVVSAGAVAVVAGNSSSSSYPFFSFSPSLAVASPLSFPQHSVPPARLTSDHRITQLPHNAPRPSSNIIPRQFSSSLPALKAFLTPCLPHSSTKLTQPMEKSLTLARNSIDGSVCSRQSYIS